jgi:hypothetical protein
MLQEFMELAFHPIQCQVELFTHLAAIVIESF